MVNFWPHGFNAVLICSILLCHLLLKFFYGLCQYQLCHLLRLMTYATIWIWPISSMAHSVSCLAPEFAASLLHKNVILESPITPYLVGSLPYHKIFCLCSLKNCVLSITLLLALCFVYLSSTLKRTWFISSYQWLNKWKEQIQTPNLKRLYPINLTICKHCTHCLFLSTRNCLLKHDFVNRMALDTLAS